jgi:hypothetical protein
MCFHSWKQLEHNKQYIYLRKKKNIYKKYKEMKSV